MSTYILTFTRGLDMQWSRALRALNDTHAHYMATCMLRALRAGADTVTVERVS